MDDTDRRIAEALEHTRVVRPPKQYLATFGVTKLTYHLLTEPSYTELAPQKPGDEGDGDT